MCSEFISNCRYIFQRHPRKIMPCLLHLLILKFSLDWVQLLQHCHFQESDMEFQGHFDGELFSTIRIKRFLTESPAAQLVIVSKTRSYPAVMVSNFLLPTVHSEVSCMENTEVCLTEYKENCNLINHHHKRVISDVLRKWDYFFAQIWG